MKRKISSLLLALMMMAALTAPAFGWEGTPAKYRTFSQYLAFYRAQTDEDTQALADYIDRRLAEGVAAVFDANAYFRKNLEDSGLGVTKENWLAWNSDHADAEGVYDEAWFQAEMLNLYLTGEYSALQKADQARTLAEKYPEEYAAFDAEAWLSGNVIDLTVAQYMAAEGQKTYEQFRQDLFRQWAAQEQNFFNGYCVTVDGVPIQFQLYRNLEGEVVGPKAENERLLIPLRAAAEALGLAVEWLPETDRVTCTRGETAVTFTLDSPAYSGGTLDAAPIAEKGVTYLPLRALGEALGCEVAWNQDFATAALTAPEEYEPVDDDPPIWARPFWEGTYASKEQFMAYNRLDTEADYYAYVRWQLAYDKAEEAAQADGQAWYARFLEEHAQEIAQFDADLYFATEYPCQDCYDGGKEEYLATWGYTEEEFQEKMKARWIRDQYEPTEDYFGDPELVALYDACHLEGAEADRWDWEHFLREEPLWAQAFLTDMEHPEREILIDTAHYRTVEECLAAHPDETLEETYWRIYYDNWSASRLAAMDAYWAFRGEHPGWCDEITLTVNGQPVYIPYGNTAICIKGEIYVNARALSNALEGTVEGDAHGYAPLPAAAEALDCTVDWDEENKKMNITLPAPNHKFDL